MLKGIDPLLGPELLMILRAMGHGDEIAIVDGNYPADSDATRLVRADGHSATALLAAIMSVLPLDQSVAEAAFRPAVSGDVLQHEPVHAEFSALINQLEPSTKIGVLVGEAFYSRVKNCYAVVASGERRLFGNIILRKGVVLPDN